MEGTRILSESKGQLLRDEDGWLPIPRRTALATAASIAALPLIARLPAAFGAEAGLKLGEPESFSFEWLIEQARTRAAAPYAPPPQSAPEVVKRIDYDAHGKLRFRPEYALFADGPGVYPITFQFLGAFFPKSVRMHVVEGGESREIVYSPDYFTVTDDSPARELPPGTNAFAGFWIQESRLQGDWRKGMVQLVEIPTDDEIHDNIAAYWLTDRPTRAGDAFNYHYRLHWVKDQPFFPGDQLARVVATRMGRGGQPGKPRPRGVYKISVEFMGGTLANLPFGVLPEPAIWVGRGTTSLIQMEAVPDDVPGHWRLFFDLTVEGEEAVDMRVFLRQGDTILSETWLYLFEPGSLRTIWPV